MKLSSTSLLIALFIVVYHHFVMVPDFENIAKNNRKIVVFDRDSFDEQIHNESLILVLSGQQIDPQKFYDVQFDSQMETFKKMKNVIVIDSKAILFDSQQIDPKGAQHEQ